ncbi:FMN-binding protein [Candidatus Neomarinimicrobiota bacterium]
MKTSKKMILVLTLVTILSGGILATWDAITRPLIELHKLEALKAAISEVLPDYDNYNEMSSDNYTFFEGRKENSDEPVGVAFEVQGSGFQGVISIMIGVRPGFESLTGIKVLEQVETPGLGTKIVIDPSNRDNPTWFPDQFRSLVVLPSIVVIRNVTPENENEVQAISGATISSRAVVRIINSQIQNAKTEYYLLSD